MWWILLLLSSSHHLVNGLEQSGNPSSGHDPGDILHFAVKCAEEYLKEAARKDNCIVYRNRIRNYSGVPLSGLESIKHKSKVFIKLSEMNAVKYMREALFKEPAEIMELKIVCNMGFFPNASMHKLVELYNSDLWSTIQPVALLEDILKQTEERLDQLGAVEAICGRIYTNDVSYFIDIEYTLRNLREQLVSAYANRTEKMDNYYAHGYVKNMLSRERKPPIDITQLSRKKKPKTIISKPAIEKKAEKQEKEETKKEEKSDDEKFNDAAKTKLSNTREKFMNKLDARLAKMDFSKLPGELKKGYNALKQFFLTGKMKYEDAAHIAKLFLGAINFIGSLIPLDHVAAITNVVTGIIGVLIDLGMPEVKSEMQILKETVQEGFRNVMVAMDKHFKGLAKEIHDTSLIHMVFIPGDTIFKSLDAFRKHNDQKTILQVCKSVTKNKLFSAVRVYVLDVQKGYFAKTLVEHGDLHSFAEIADAIKMYMLIAIQAEMTCIAIEQNAQNGTFDYDEEEMNVDPTIKWMWEDNNELSEMMDTFKYVVEMNSMRKAEKYFLNALSGFDMKNESALHQKTVELANQINSLWSVRYEFHIVWGNMLRFVISDVAYTHERSEYISEDVIVNTKEAERSYAIIRKLKTNNGTHGDPLDHFIERWHFYQRAKAEDNRYFLNMVSELIPPWKVPGQPGWLRTIFNFWEGIANKWLDKGYLEDMKNTYKSMTSESNFNPANTTVLVKSRVIGISPKNDLELEHEERVKNGHVQKFIDLEDLLPEEFVDIFKSLQELPDFLSKVQDWIVEVASITQDGFSSVLKFFYDKYFKAFLDTLKESIPFKLGFKFEKLIEWNRDNIGIISKRFIGMTFAQFEVDGYKMMYEESFPKGQYRLVYAWGKNIYYSGSNNFTTFTKDSNGSRFLSIEY